MSQGKQRFPGLTSVTCHIFMAASFTFHVSCPIKHQMGQNFKKSQQKTEAATATPPACYCVMTKGCSQEEAEHAASSYVATA